MNEEELAAAEAATAEAAQNADAIEEDAADLWAEFDELDGIAPEEGEATTADADTDAGDGADTGTGGDVIDGAVAGADAAAVATAVAAAPSVWDNAPAELRTEYEKLAADRARLEHEVRSHKGRAVGAQRRYEDLLKAAEPRKVEGDRPTPQAALAALKEDYPEIAGPLEQALGSIQGQVATLSEAEESRRTAAQTELSDFLQNETTSLVSQHPDYLEVLGKNSDALVAWIDDQPRAVRDAFARNANEIVNAAEAATVIGLFKAHLGKPAPAPAAEQPRTATTPPLASRRERQLGATANPTRSHRRPTVSGIPENGDPQDIWDAFEEAERR